MSFTWKPTFTSPHPDPTDVAESGLDTEFTDQQEAEDWLRENFDLLQEVGVAEVELLDDGTVVYGPMSLDA